jgi:hypothetical protein
LSDAADTQSMKLLLALALSASACASTGVPPAPLMPTLCPPLPRGAIWIGPEHLRCTEARLRPIGQGEVAMAYPNAPWKIPYTKKTLPKKAKGR